MSTGRQSVLEYLVAKCWLWVYKCRLRALLRGRSHPVLRFWLRCAPCSALVIAPRCLVPCGRPAAIGLRLERRPVEGPMWWAEVNAALKRERPPLESQGGLMSMKRLEKNPRLKSPKDH
jgi:hypothetical protein